MWGCVGDIRMPARAGRSERGGRRKLSLLELVIPAGWGEGTALVRVGAFSQGPQVIAGVGRATKDNFPRKPSCWQLCQTPTVWLALCSAWQGTVGGDPVLVNCSGVMERAQSQLASVPPLSLMWQVVDFLTSFSLPVKWGQYCSPLA